MKDYVLFEEIGQGNVFAAFKPMRKNGSKNIDGLGAVYFRKNSAVASTSASPDYLKTKCRRISENRARKIHPRLFQLLEPSVPAS